ncbi:MAG TPA: hypothetical protein ENG63_08285 [Candidatus Desulfofervidus auxilii]|uniref:Uncharacterized protein n=1 Tax=Desulfofervidus auxilii TaxID=1621989 RepID=A0A7C0Y5E0_DESA2|nr:hypothetical protein [Candidatus Desulfofervidus auxilii]
MACSFCNSKGTVPYSYIANVTSNEVKLEYEVICPVCLGTKDEHYIDKIEQSLTEKDKKEK